MTAVEILKSVNFVIGPKRKNPLFWWIWQFGSKS